MKITTIPAKKRSPQLKYYHAHAAEIARKRRDGTYAKPSPELLHKYWQRAYYKNRKKILEARAIKYRENKIPTIKAERKL
jgi:hypothetical protein